MEQARKIGAIMDDIRDLKYSDRRGLMPVSFVRGANHQSVDPMLFKKGKWTKTQWDGVTCLGIQLTKNCVTVICEVDYPLRMDRQEHGPWSERLVMIEGEMYEHTNGETYKPGDGVFYKPAGVVHEPEFKAPSVCVITWERD
jgi:quercetin dioxygenase-like cupin family protein